MTGLAEKAIPLHLGHMLPMGFTELGQRVVHQYGAEKNTGSGADPDDQVDDLNIVWLRCPKGRVTACQHQKIDIRANPEPVEGQKGRGQHIAQSSAEQGKAENAKRDPDLTHVSRLSPRPHQRAARVER
ncbi:hypothetical protein [Falsiruegeria mediterranea]|uniref:Uncharacterized protein n=1 Tax=Falsiruegeria mediterranea M17 TaxID=1200281 RepID=A0A2R8CG33_9RHOB|nr:hypothetical protein [Falsiruegeria mediterranea]SPJ31404.1 hypothetical protein TRM7615_04947 [Falsiruegeria mediterranea M17]